MFDVGTLLLGAFDMSGPINVVIEENPINVVISEAPVKVNEASASPNKSITISANGPQGPPGPVTPGTKWFVYNGFGIPTGISANQNDLCIRESDGEVFQWDGAMWVDMALPGNSLGA